MTLQWSTACPDWEQRIVNSQSLIKSPPLFPQEAIDSMAVFNSLKLKDVPGQPAIGDSSREWLQNWVSVIFGSLDPETGRRMIQEYLLLISKKNSKSGSAAAIMLTALIRNWRESAEFLILAPTIEIAMNSFAPARDMIDLDPDLRSLLHVQPHTRTITHHLTGAQLKIVAADRDTVSGKKATGVLVDELWLFGSKANAQNMLLEATGGLTSRPEGFVIYLSTQSDKPPAGVFKEKLNYARDVRDGNIVDPQFLPVIYEFPEAMLESKAYLDPKNFYVTNPNLDLSVDRQYLERNLTKVLRSTKESQAGFLAKHLNIEMGIALRHDAWAGAEFWEQCGRFYTLEQIIDRCEVITVGIDGGGLDDLYGLAVLGREMDTGNWISWCYAWAHPIVLERRPDIAEQLKDFEAEGSLTLVNEMGDDLVELVDIISNIYDSGLLAEIGCDQHGLGSTVDALLDADIPEDMLIGIPQGWKLQGAIKTVERRLSNQSLLHSKQTMMAWCVGNAKTRQAGNATLITKAESGTAKIDPLIALFNAAACMVRNPESQGGPDIHILEVG